MQITVLMPVYNDEDNLKQAIFSILNQSYTDYEFLIIDDGSSDDSCNLIKSINDKRINLIKKEHTGLWDTLNYGLKTAKNNIIARMDADDISLPSRIEKQLNYLRLNPQIDVVSSWYAIFDKRIRYTIKTSEKSDDIKKRMLLHSEIVHSGLIYKKDKILSLGGYSNYKVEDHEFWLRNFNNLLFYNIQEVLTIKRYRVNSLSNLNKHNNNKEIYSFLEVYQEMYYKELNLDINILKGWKEYFYGDKDRSRYYFNKFGIKVIFKPRVLFAYLLSFTSDSFNFKFKELNIKFLIQYLLLYFTKSNKHLRKFYKSIQ